MESDQAGESQLLLEKVSLFVMYVPAENKEVNVPARHRLLEAINEHGGNLLSRKDVLQPQNVGKFTALAVNRNAMPRSLPLLPGTAVYDGTWVLDCIQAGKLLPKAEYLLVQGSPPGGAQPAKAATPGRAAGPSAPRLSTVVLGDENQAEQGQRSGGGERKTPKKKRCAEPPQFCVPGAHPPPNLTRPPDPARRTRRTTTASCGTLWRRTPGPR